MDRMRLVLLGATGMVGGCVLRLAVEDDRVARIVSISRRTVGIEHPKVEEILHNDFLDYSAVDEALEGADAALFCLGAYTGAVPDEELRRVTFDVAVAFARALHAASPRAALCFLSGQGADHSGRSRMAFARYKGAAEKALLGLELQRLHIFRPGYIYPVAQRREPNLGYRITRCLYPVLRRLYPNIGISSIDLARAMLDTAIEGTPDMESCVLENRRIRELARRHR